MTLAERMRARAAVRRQYQTMNDVMDTVEPQYEDETISDRIRREGVPLFLSYRGEYQVRNDN